ncbi:TPA: hypothetical protein N3Z77_004704 [Salmonella enterica subsp. enterica serovar 14:z:e,n,x]|nr:hypothetical protein [Salmonella enterica subsp. enterica serovar 14:z:e,n,x]
MSVHNNDMLRCSVLFTGYFISRHCPLDICKGFNLKRATDKEVMLTDQFFKDMAFLMSIGVDKYADEYDYFIWQHCKTPQDAVRAGYLKRVRGGWQLTDKCNEECREQFITMGDACRQLFKHSLSTFSRVYQQRTRGY